MGIIIVDILLPLECLCKHIPTFGHAHQVVMSLENNRFKCLLQPMWWWALLKVELNALFVDKKFLCKVFQVLHATAVKCQWDSILVGKGRAEQPFHKSTRFNLLPVRCTSRDTDSASKKGFEMVLLQQMPRWRITILFVTARERERVQLLRYGADLGCSKRGEITTELQGGKCRIDANVIFSTGES